MENATERTNPSWGMKINGGWFPIGRKCPEWANNFQRKIWGESGLIIWDETAKTITHVLASNAINVLEYLSITEEWKLGGIVVGEPATRLIIGKTVSETKTALKNEINLTVEQCTQLLDFLQRNKDDLERIQEQEKQHRRHSLGKVYSILLKFAVRRDKTGS
jgi:hypothetical protein